MTNGNAQRPLARRQQLRSTGCKSGDVLELYYLDGDVGAYDGFDGSNFWAQFTPGHEPSHIVIRPNTEAGQSLSNRLYRTSKMAAALKALVDAINATGGLVSSGPVSVAPAADPEWVDLGDAYLLACEALGVTPFPHAK
jgi:hypothetical protein